MRVRRFQLLNKTGTVSIAILLILPFAAMRSAPAADATADPSLLTIDRIFKSHEFDSMPWRPPYWIKSGTSFITTAPSGRSYGGTDLVANDPDTGERKILVAGSQLIPPGITRSPLNPGTLAIEDFAFSDDLRKLLIFTNSKRVWRQHTRGDYWLLDRDSNRFQKLGGDGKESSMMFATLSPDGTRVAYVRDNNLFVQNLRDMQITQLTSDGGDNVVNGTSDWVNEEEFDLRDGFRWSPDGEHIAYWQFDTSRVRSFQLINDTAGLYPEIMTYKYPKAGETNSACRIGVVSRNGGPTRWLDTKAEPSSHYLPQMEWSPDSRHVYMQQLNRLQNTSQILRGRISDGQTTVVFTDRDAAWVDVPERSKWTWVGHGKRFLCMSERDGWRHLYSVSQLGKSVRLLTPGSFDVIDLLGVDEELGCVYFTASPQNPTQCYLYRAALDGSGRPTRVTPDGAPGTPGQPGSHAYYFSPDHRRAFHVYSRMNRPPSVELLSMPEHEVISDLTDNDTFSGKRRLNGRLAALKPCPSEFFRVDIGNGILLDGWCIKPPNFDPAKHYPLLMYVYGEPAAQTVVDRWGGTNYLWHCMLAQHGYLVMSVDNRGTAAPRGREWRKCIYKQLGTIASADQAAALRKIIAERPYVDPKRIGIWGWSGGGSMSLHAIFRYPDLYATAMAVASVSDERLYDTIYEERYMGLPSDNAEGYKNGSPITFAHQLRDSANLLLVHGTGDDNCHYQGCELLINELIRNDRPFSMMAYPNRTHAIQEGPNTRLHLFQTLTRYLETNLPPGGR